MIIDGKKIASAVYDAVKKKVAEREAAPRLGILTCAPTFETEKYLNLKQKKAAEVGIKIEVVRLEESASTDAVCKELAALVLRTDGVVVQLPLPPTVDTASVIAALPSTHDVDALNPRTTQVLSPVVGAMAEILQTYKVPLIDQHVTIIGSGKLVGLPASRWFMEQGAAVSVVTKDTADISYYTKNADIIVSGAGVPGLLTPNMMKEGAVILDAGTSEEGGELKGDADPLCEEKASLFTPVPGGIGPITIAVLLKNVVELTHS